MSKAMENAIDRWFKFIDEYNKESSIPLSYVLLPNPATTGFRTMGSPIGMTKLSKSEWCKVVKLNFSRAYCSTSSANKSNGTGGRGGVVSPKRCLKSSARRVSCSAKISEGGQRPKAAEHRKDKDETTQ